MDADARPAAVRPLAAFSVPNFRRFVIGQTVSLVGSWTETVAQALLVLQLTHSGLWLGLATAARYLPVLVLTPYAGLIVDRADKRRVLLTTQLSLAVLSLILAALVLLGAIELWMVFAVALGFGVLTALDNPARMAFIPEMVGPDLIRNAVTLNSTMVNVGRALGPVVAAAENLLVHPDHRGGPGGVGDRDQPHPGWGAGVQRQVGDLGHQQGLGGFGDQARRGQPPGQVARLVVGVVLPLPGPAHRREPAGLSRDHGVGAGLGEVTPQDAIPAVTSRDDPGDVLVALDQGPGLAGRVPAQLLVELGQHRGSIHRDISASRTRAGQPVMRTGSAISSQLFGY